MADAALPHLVAEQLPGVDVLFLDTGYHFAETTPRATRSAAPRRRVVDVLPEQTVAEQDRVRRGAVRPRPRPVLRAAQGRTPATTLAGYELWFTGVRREEAPTRTNTPLVTWDERNGLVKVNPVAAWSFDDLLDYAGAHRCPSTCCCHNGYPSIGCEPCTRRWRPARTPARAAGPASSKTECGLHL